MSAGESDPRWPAYPEYQRLRHAGLRRDALAVASVCAVQITAAGAQRDFTRWLFTEVVDPAKPLPPVLPHPLREIALPALWAAHHDGQTWATAALIRWFPTEVMAAYDYAADAVRALLTDARSAHPGDPVPAAMLARHLLTWVRHDITDLANGRYDGDPHADLARLTEAQNLIAAGDPMGVEIDRVRAVVAEWVQRRSQPEAPD